jgi:long-chain fatty acid transport protein
MMCAPLPPIPSPSSPIPSPSGRGLGRGLSLPLLLLVLLPASIAQAGGLFLLDRGSRPLSRGGAFIAGADDPSALWYNPAGLARSKNQLLTDFTLTFPFASFRRLNSDGEFSPKVEATPTLLPIPTLALSHQLGARDFTFGAGVFAPNTLLLNWPRSVPGPNLRRDPGPTRYSLLGLQGSVLANVALGFAWHGVEGLSIGADVQVALGRFRATTALSAADGVVCAFPEQPDCDAYTTLDVLPAWGVTGTVGIQYSLRDLVLWGASVSLPYTLRGSAKLGLKPPSGEVFEDAYFTGDRASFALKFPTIVRVGSELRPWDFLRMEGAFVWEQWSRQQTLDVKPSEDIYLRNITGIGDYQIGALHIPRKMRDTWSVRGGYELFLPDDYAPRVLKRLRLAFRGGLAYERSAFSHKHTTPMTLDSDKIVLSAGTSFYVHKRVRMDGTIGYMFMTDLKVRSSSVRQPTSLRPTPGSATALGNGDYKMDALYIGGGLTVVLD